jgi:hypothetical protein
MGRRAISSDEVGQILQALREATNRHGDISFSKAARVAGVDRKTMLRYYSDGIPAAAGRPAIPGLRFILDGVIAWPPSGDGTTRATIPPPAAMAPGRADVSASIAPATAPSPPVPLSHQVGPLVPSRPADVGDALSREIASLEAQVPEILRRENLLAKAGRENSLAGAILSSMLLNGLRPLIEVTQRKLSEMAASDFTSPSEAIGLMKEVIKINSQIIDQAREVAELQRVVVGAPISKVEVTHRPAPPTENHLEQAARMVARINDLKRADAERRARVIDVEAMPPGLEGGTPLVTSGT